MTTRPPPPWGRPPHFPRRSTYAWQARHYSSQQAAGRHAAIRMEARSSGMAAARDSRQPMVKQISSSPRHAIRRHIAHVGMIAAARGACAHHAARRLTASRHRLHRRSRRRGRDMMAARAEAMSPLERRRSAISPSAVARLPSLGRTIFHAGARCNT